MCIKTCITVMHEDITSYDCIYITSFYNIKHINSIKLKNWFQLQLTYIYNHFLPQLRERKREHFIKCIIYGYLFICILFVYYASLFYHIIYLFIISGQGGKCTVYVCTLLCIVQYMFFVRTDCLRHLWREPARLQLHLQHSFLYN